MHANWHTLDQMLADYKKRRNYGDVSRPHLFALCAVDNLVARFARTKFMPSDVYVDGQNDTGIDGIGILVNGDVVTSVEDIERSIEKHRDLDVRFVFVQATMDREFRENKMNGFALGVWKFFQSQEMGPRSDRIVEAVALKDAIFERAQRMRSGRPTVNMYYISTGQWVGDEVLEGALMGGEAMVDSTDLFKSVEYSSLDLRAFLDLRRAQQVRLSGDVHSFMLQQLPQIEGADDAYIGAMLVSDLINLVRHPSGDRVNRNVFIENVRGFQGNENHVNAGINNTLGGEQAAMFPLLNNGVTIVCHDCEALGPKIRMFDYQIVNGCQTTSVLFYNRARLKNESILVPAKIVVTRDEAIIESIICSTNNQTEVSDDHILSLIPFNRRLAEYYRAMLLSGKGEKLYYDLREGEFAANRNLPKHRVILIRDQLQTFASMFLGRPHDAIIDLKALRGEVHKRIFNPDHVPETYYTASLAAFLFEALSEDRLIDPVFRNYRFQLLHVLRKKMFPEQFSLSNWNVAPILCREANDRLLNREEAVQLFGEACEILREAGRMLSVPDLPRETASRKAFTEAVNEILADESATAEVVSSTGS